MNDKPDIVQQFRNTKLYWWIRHAVERIAVWILDTTICISFFVFGCFLWAFFNLGIKITICVLLWLASMITGWHASYFQMGEAWKSAGLLGKTMSIVFFATPPLFSAMMIWGMSHTDD